MLQGSVGKVLDFPRFQIIKSALADEVSNGGFALGAACAIATKEAAVKHQLSVLAEDTWS